MRSTRARTPAVVLVAAFTLVASCTSGGGENLAEPATTSASTGTTTRADDTDAATDTTVDAGETTATTSATPATRGPDLPQVDLGEFNIGHGRMSEELVELSWTSVEGDEVTHRVHRVPTIGTDPATVDLTTAPLVYSGPDTSFTDLDAPAGEFWTYVLEIDADGATADRRAWTSVLTVTDETPPAPITGLTATVGDDGVLLRWDPSDDDVEFGAYAVLLVADDGTATYLGGGASVGETSFLDDRPPTGSATYRVQAVDYHDNRSTAEITVEVG